MTNLRLRSSSLKAFIPPAPNSKLSPQPPPNVKKGSYWIQSHNHKPWYYFYLGFDGHN